MGVVDRARWGGGCNSCVTLGSGAADSTTEVGTVGIGLVGGLVSIGYYCKHIMGANSTYY